LKFLASVVAVLVMSVPAVAQPRDPDFPASGKLDRASVVFLDGEGVRSILLLPEGTSVTVIGRDGPWYRITFTSSLGNQTGRIAPNHVRLDQGTTSAGGDARKVSERGFAEGRGFLFPQEALNDTTQSFGDGLVRQEVFLKPSRSFQLAAGVDLRGSSYDQVEDSWRLDFEDRGTLRPRLAIRRLTASVTTTHVSVDLGKQFVRWGRADILSPTDRFAPRDYLNVIENEFLPVLAARGSIHAGGETLEAVWVPQLTPSRMPLLNQRWTVAPPEAAGFVLEDSGAIFPEKSQQGFRWSHTGRFEMGLSFFNGFNHLPDLATAVDSTRQVIGVTRSYPELRTYGGEASIPTRVVTLKGEAAYFTSPDSTSEEYVLYVIEIERQIGEWLLDGGYAGEIVTTSHPELSFAAERGLARSIIGRASYAIDPRRTVTIEGAVRQDGNGFYARGEFSQAFGQHWRLTLAGVGLGGEDDDFLGQFQRNSHIFAALRLSY